MYRIREFADLAGVTVRALHHYDRLKLLQPRRTGAGYRVYADQDLERLEQIVALKFIGLSLAEVKALLDREAVDLGEALRQQERVLEEKRRLLDRALDAVREARTAAIPRTEALRKIIEVMEMQNNTDWATKYYSEEALEKIEARKSLWSPELQAETDKAWKELISDVEAALDKDPTSPEAQALGDRWSKLIEGFTGGDPQIAAGLRAFYQDKANWPQGFQNQMEPFINPRVSDFIDQVMAARKSA